MTNIKPADAAASVVQIYESLADDLLAKGCTPEVIYRLANTTEQNRITSTVLEQRPERYVEEQVVWPTLDVLNHPYRTEVYCPTEKVYFDLFIESNRLDLFGEVKKLGDIGAAKQDMIEYLGKGIADTNIGLATDGLTWRVFEVDLDLKRREPTDIARFEFKEVIFSYIAATTGWDPERYWWGEPSIESIDRYSEALQFVSAFSHRSLSTALKTNR